MKNTIAFFIIAVAMIAFMSCSNCTYDEELGACVEDLPEDGNTPDNAKPDNTVTDDATVSDVDNTAPEIGHEGGACFENGTCMEGLDCVPIDNDKDICVDLTKDDDSLTDETITDDATTTDVDIIHTGDEGEPCLTGNKCNDDLVCHEATQICVLPETGEEGEGCYPNHTCDTGLTCDQASQNATDTCVKSVGVIGAENGSCRPDRTCDAGLACFREDFLCQDMPTIGTRTICWSRELNVEPVQDSCSAKGGIAPAAFEYVTGTKTPDCDGLVDVDPEFECVRSNATVEQFRNATSVERDNFALTSSYYLPPTN